MPIAPTTLYDSFKRTVANSWGTSDSGHVWLSDESSDYNVSSSRGRITTTPGTALRSTYVNVANNSSQEVLMKVKVNTTNYMSDWGPIICREDSNTFYYARIQPNFDTIGIWVNRDGTEDNLSGNTSYSVSADTYYWIRFSRVGSTLTMKIWLDGAAESSGTTVTTSTSGAAGAPGAGDFGVFTRGTTASYTVSVDTLYWYTLEDETPSLPITDTFDRLHDNGFGLTNTSHLWQGNFSDDPTYYAAQAKGNVSSSGYATFTSNNDSTSYFGFVGPNMNEADVLMSGTIDQNAGNLSVGARADFTVSSGVISHNGYMARLVYGSSTLTLFERTGATYTSLGTFALAAAPATSEKWWIRLQCTGTTIRCRAWKDGGAEPGTWGISVVNALYTSGKSFFRYQGSSALVSTFKLYDFSANIITSVNALTTTTLATSSITDTGFSVTASYSGDADADSTCTIQYRVQGDEAWTSATVTTNRGPKTFTATVAGLTQGTVYEVKATYADADGLSGTNPLTTTATTTFRGIDTGGITVVNTNATVAVTATYTNDSDDDSTATVEWRLSPAGSFNSPQAMTAHRSSKTFTYTIPSLAEDTQYEVRVTYADADGVRGTNPITLTTTTLGTGVESSTIVGTTTETSATVVLTYLYDSNENSSVVFQYRPIHHALWTNINASSVTTNRGAKTFTTTIAGLFSGVSYQIQAVLSDPNGINPGAADTVTTIVTTKGSTFDPEKPKKAYLYKIYTIDHRYLGTWRDAQIPEFTHHQNGGVTDLTVTLPRQLSALNADPTVTLSNRVDIWAVDPMSMGFGPNLLYDEDIDQGEWTLGTNWSVSTRGGPDDSDALLFNSATTTASYAQSAPAYWPHRVWRINEETDTNYLEDVVVPINVTSIVKARGGKLRMDVAAFDIEDNQLGTSDYAESIGSRWQNLSIDWTPPEGTYYTRVRLQNIGKGRMYADKVKVLAKEMLIYRGRIETINPRVDTSGEDVEIEIVGLVSQLSDDYIEFRQYVTFQPSRDSDANQVNHHPADPSQMMKDILDIAAEQNPRFDLYYTEESIKMTGSVREYTFRDQTIFNCLDKIRILCPPGWHWYVEADGKVHLRGPQHVRTHKLRLNVEVMKFRNPQTVRDMKNVILVRGRQDEDKSETDQAGSIRVQAVDQEQADNHGRRVRIIRDANLITVDDAETVAEGRLEEQSVVEQQSQATIPDEKSIQFGSGSSLRGYNIESLRPGDFVQIKNPISGTQRTYWDQFSWDNGAWDSNDSRMLPSDVPIKEIKYHGDTVEINLSERPPSATGRFAQMTRIMQSRNADTFE